ncbi:GAP family protein [Arthrobacter sp. UYCu712]|uniref:GAP family protein n=1 Tax=Arthrobacter sp. UYCu712 TaxID=3156340 RepID=UPI00339099D2
MVGLSAVGLRFLPVRPEVDRDVFLSWFGLFIGTILIAYAIYLFTHKTTSDSAVLGKLKTKFHSARPWQFVVLGLGLNLHPKALLLAVTAGALISVREPPVLEGSLFVLAYAAVAQSAVVLPVAVWMRSPERAEVPLTALYTWLQRNGRSIEAIATLAIGLFIVGYSILQFISAGN